MALVIVPVKLPAVLVGQSNGRLSDSILVSTPGLGGGPTVRLVQPAARAWRALSGTAPMVLKATSVADSYRSYAQQVATFTSRYEPDRFPGYIAEKLWPAHYDLQGRFVEAHRWFQKPKTAVAAIPGTSNHGFGLAVDVANAAGSRLDWLEAHAQAYGWSWETVPSEPWHIRYTEGDRIPAAVLAYEQAPPTPGDSMNHILVREGTTGPIWLCDGFWRRRVKQEWLDPNVTGPITNARTHLDALLGNLKTGKSGNGQPGQWEGTGQIFVASETGDEMDVWGIDMATLVVVEPAPGAVAGTGTFTFTTGA